MAIYLGKGDVAAVRRTLANAIVETAPPLTLRVTCGQFLEELRSDPQIDRLHLQLFGW